MKKEKLIPCIVTSREGMEATVADVVRLKLEFAQATVAMELDIASVQKRHQDRLLNLSRQIETKEAGVFVFCQANRKELFPKQKSIDLLLATVGFRDDPPSVEKTAKKDTWSAVAMRLASLDWGMDYITDPQPDVDKKALLSDRLKLTDEQLAAAGIKFEAEEQFYIKPKSEVAEASKIAA